MENVSAFVYDHRIVRPDGSVRMLHTRGEVVAGRDGRVARLVGSCWDITDRWEALRRAEKARTDAEAARHEMENILGRVADGFVAVDRDCRYRYVNESARRVMQRDPLSLIGKLMWDEFPEVRGHEFQHACERALAEQRPAHLRTYFQPWRRWFEGRIHPSPEGLSIFFTDVTEQQKAQEELRASAEQLRALAARLSEIREEERKSIARELHDQVGQALTALKLDLEWTRGQIDVGAKPEARARLAAMDTLLDQTLDTTRRISATLRPAILDDLGLPAALRWQAAEFTQRTGVACETRLPDADPPLAPATALALFRILQEALTNVARHAGAKNVRIGLTLEGPSAVLTVADDGRGIAPGMLSRQTSLGLMGMRERALAFGGTLELSAEGGPGTTVVVRVPVEAGETG